MQLYKISSEFIVDKSSDRQFEIAVEVNLTPQTFCEQQDLFVIYQSLIYAVCLAKSNSEERGVRKKGRVSQTTVCAFESVLALLCLLGLKKKMIKGLEVQCPLRVAWQVLCDD